ncbi:unnamed protein product [Paramecium sonneborni]|uniref:Uncharacterized protein n=1 Tax=Paramecium sonneborni TaxID=65129 RepID=A0A8S1R994_9CILI|nr:unnamed protein product [Paramecium sonneborni]
MLEINLNFVKCLIYINCYTSILKEQMFGAQVENSLVLKKR